MATGKPKTFGKSGLVIHAQAREIVARVIAFMREEADLYQRAGQVKIHLTHYKQRVISATGISEATYCKIMKEAAKVASGAMPTFQTPRKRKADDEEEKGNIFEDKDQAAKLAATQVLSNQVNVGKPTGVPVNIRPPTVPIHSFQHFNFTKPIVPLRLQHLNVAPTTSQVGSPPTAPAPVWIIPPLLIIKNPPVTKPEVNIKKTETNIFQENQSQEKFYCSHSLEKYHCKDCNFSTMCKVQMFEHEDGLESKEGEHWSVMPKESKRCKCRKCSFSTFSRLIMLRHLRNKCKRCDKLYT